jgi:hypothetical protein
MQQISERRSRSRIGKVLGTAAAAVLCLAVLSQPNPALAEPHGGGGGFHDGSGGGFHGRGGFSGFHGGFHPGFGAFHQGGFHDGRFHGGRFFGGVGFGGYYPYDDGYYGYAEPSYSQTWYYCANPAGYYPYVTQCYTAWQAVSG